MDALNATAHAMRVVRMRRKEKEKKKINEMVHHLHGRVPAAVDDLAALHRGNAGCGAVAHLASSGGDRARGYFCEHSGHG